MYKTNIYTTVFLRVRNLTGLISLSFMNVHSFLEKRHRLTGMYVYVFQFPRQNKEGITFLRDLACKHGRAYRLWLGPFYAVVMVCHPDLFKVVALSSEPKEMSLGYKLILSWLGKLGFFKKDKLLVLNSPFLICQLSFYYTA